ncbi:ArsR family transcriptional regulator [Candidatus Bathyarchaeota archaeon]|nr:ArsR family transcriptional regulator [Candidatus Bathyarchaeota archaeon]
MLEDLCDLLFELSSMERMDIMLSLLEEKQRLSHISQRLGMTVTETSRHLQRLSDVQLVIREVDGRFSLTKYGALAIDFLPDLEFISKNRRYFLEHEVHNIPYEFSNRLGELLDSTLEIDAVRVLDRVTTILKEAGEHIWAQSYHISPNHIPILEKKVRDDVDFRGIYPTNFELTSRLVNYLHFLETIKKRILVTEKEAMVSFTHITGQLDYPLSSVPTQNSSNGARTYTNITGKKPVPFKNLSLFHI